MLYYYTTLYIMVQTTHGIKYFTINIIPYKFLPQTLSPHHIKSFFVVNK